MHRGLHRRGSEGFRLGSGSLLTLSLMCGWSGEWSHTCSLLFERAFASWSHHALPMEHQCLLDSAMPGAGGDRHGARHSTHAKGGLTQDG
jgi:hypothetical protein